MKNPSRRRHVVEAIHYLGAALGRQVDRQAFLAERGLYLRDQRFQVDALRVDLVDDDDAVALALRGPAHHAHRHGLDAGGGADHHRRRFHRFQCRQRLAEEVGCAGRVDQVGMHASVPEVHQRSVERTLRLFLEGVMVADGGAALHAARRADGAGLPEQRLHQAGLAGGRRSYKGQRAQLGDFHGCWHSCSPLWNVGTC